MTASVKINELAYAALFAALIAIMGLVSIPLPFSPVPVTGQTLAIMLAGSLLTVRTAFFSVLTFILLGSVGLPVFAGFTGGLGVIAGPLGGYLLGFLLGAPFIAATKGSGRTPWRLALANSIGGMLLVYLCGVLWLSHITGMDLAKALLAGAVPYLPGDVAKVMLASVISPPINRQLRR